MAAGLDVKVARVNFFPQLFINGGVGLQSFVINHLFEPNAVIGNIPAGLVGPFVNFRAIQAQYLTANARQLQALYSYQRVILEAVTQVVNRLTMVQNYGKSIEIRKQQVAIAREQQSKTPPDFIRILARNSDRLLDVLGPE